MGLFLVTIIFNLALPFFGIIFLGVLAEKAFRIEESGLAWLNVFVFYFAVPTLVFQSIMEAPVSELLNWSFIAVTMLSSYLVFFLMFCIAVLVFRSSMTSSALQASSASYSNLVYLGLPLAVAAFGSGAAVPAALIACFDNLIQFSLVPVIAGLDRNNGRSALDLMKGILKEIGQNPLIIAALAGIVASASQVDLPHALDTLLTTLSRAAGPAALFALGVTVALRPVAAFRKEIPVVLVLKMIVHPLLVWFLLQHVGGIDRTWAGVAVLLASLPTGANVFILATRYRAFIDGASNVILISTMLSVLSISVMLFLIDRQFIP